MLCPRVTSGLPEVYAGVDASAEAARLAPLLERRLLADDDYEQEGRMVANDKIRDHEVSFSPT